MTGHIEYLRKNKRGEIFPKRWDTKHEGAQDARVNVTNRPTIAGPSKSGGKFYGQETKRKKVKHC
jgi:hypothetical protein